MALSALEQAYLDYTTSHGGRGGSYWGTELSGGQGNIAGGTRGGGTGGGKTGGGSPPPAKADGGVKPDGGSKLVDMGHRYSTTTGGDSFAWHNGWMKVDAIRYYTTIPCDGYEYTLIPGTNNYESRKLPDCPKEVRSAPTPVQDKAPFAVGKLAFWGSFDWHF
jgi:hypothetical protein